MKKQILAAVLSTLTLALWADEQKIIFSFDGETGNKPSQFVKERRWEIGGDDAAGTIEIVRANDHANGGKALKLTKKNGLSQFDRLRVNTRNLDFKAGCSYRISGWFKADREGLAQIQLTSPWEKNRKQWFKPINFRVNKEWKRYSFEFKVPEATPDSTLSLGKLYLLFGFFQNSLNELYAKDIVWEKGK